MLNPGAYLPWAVFTGSPLKLLRNVNKAAGPNAVQFSRWSCVGSAPKHSERKLPWKRNQVLRVDATEAAV